MIRRDVLNELDWKPYYFDIDVFQQAVMKGHRRIAVLKTGILHLYSDSISTFRRKQARRIRDYFHHSRLKNRTYRYSAVPKSRYLLFILFTVAIFPLLLQAIKGYTRKPDPAWFFHPLACWITLVEYSIGSAISLFHTSEYNRKNWEQ
jgi:hypothetical protein